MASSSLVIDDAGFNFKYVRYNADGTPDTSFQPFRFDPEDGPHTASGPIIEFTPDGKLIGGGTDEGTSGRCHQPRCSPEHRRHARHDLLRRRRPV
jgi:hypothetical protein